MRTPVIFGLCLVGLVMVFGNRAQAQDSYDPSWYNPALPYVKISVEADGVYQITGSTLSGTGVSIGSINPATLKLYENGVQVPMLVEGSGSTLTAGHKLSFVGKRNTGADEIWKFGYIANLQSSTYHSLYTATTTYWLTWGGANGLRYTTPAPPGAAPAVSTLPKVSHLETDNFSLYYEGDGVSVVGNPLYTRGEGYYMDVIQHTNTSPIEKTYTVPLAGVNRSVGQNVTITARLSSQTSSGHRVVLEVRHAPGGTGTPAFVEIDNVQWSGYAFATLMGTIPHNEIPTGSDALTVRLRSENTTDVNPSGAGNNILVDYVEVNAYRTLTDEAGQLNFTATAAGTFQFNLAVAGGSNTRILRPDNARTFLVQSPGTSFTDSPAAGTAYWGVVDTNYLSPVSVTLDESSNLATSSNAADYLIITTPFLTSSAQALANYRSSAAGGNYQVQIVELQDVFDQFDYGRHRPIAIRRLIETSQAWANPPEFLMLWGDALYPKRTQPLEPWEVISFGKSSSDGWFSMQFDGINDWSEELHTGRIPIRENQEGSDFVTKLQSYESRPLDDWMKRAVIMAGGSNESEQSLLQNSSDIWSSTIANPPFGGDVTKYYKTAATVLDPTFLDSLHADIHDGVAWIGYFGHSSATTYEIVTDPPEEFDNATVLPVVASFGCYNGEFADPNLRVFAEDLVLKSPNGAVAHWGGTTASFIGPAASIANPIYDVIFEENERILGAALTEGKRRYVGATPSSLTISTNLQYNLVGDPATRLNMPDEPDLYLEPNLVAMEPFAPSPADGTLNVDVTVKNKGLVPDGDVTVRLVNWTPNGESTEYTQQLPPIALSETATFSVPLTEAHVGDNRFRAEVDPANTIAESDEVNNNLDKSLVVFSSGVTPVYPADPGLVTSTQPTLRVSLGAQFAENTPVMFELDTDPAFASPNQTATVASSFATDWKPSALTNGQSYYWRARVDDPTKPEEDWKTSSFTVRTDLTGEGWYQQGNQFLSDSLGRFLTYGSEGWDFKTFNLSVGAIHNLQLSIGPQIYFRNTRGYSAIVINGGSGEIRDSFNAFDPTPADVQGMEDLLALAEPGDIVLAHNRTFFAGWGWTDDAPETQQIRSAFASEIGATLINTITYQNAWVMFAEVGNPSGIQEWIAPEGTERAEEYDFKYTQSDVLSSLIGPAQSWGTVTWEGTLDNASSRIDLEVLSADGSVLTSGALTFPNGEQSLNLSSINAQAHPTLRLRAIISDDDPTTVPQLTSWYVTYTPVPDLVLDPASFSLSSEIVAEGQSLRVAASISNLGTSTVDKAVLLYEVTDAENNTTLVGTDTLAALEPMAVATSAVDVSTLGLAGENRLVARVVQSGVQEPIIHNNLAVRTFVVSADQTPPTLQVSIDGTPYPSDERVVTSTNDASVPFISARPTIEVLLKDDNPYVPLEDTSLVAIALDGVRLGFDRPDIQFQPGTREKNEARILFTPDFSAEDTTHTLTLWARDPSGNANPTELNPYQVHFRIAATAALENLYPYPNPMTTSTVFAFNLQSSDPGLVEDLRVRLYTLNGQLVREFDLIDEPSLLESGALRVGWNKVPWDGTDADGDQVSRGVYLYKVFLRIGGEAVPVNNDSSIEKLVVIR